MYDYLNLGGIFTYCKPRGGGVVGAEPIGQGGDSWRTLKLVVQKSIKLFKKFDRPKGAGGRGPCDQKEASAAIKGDKWGTWGKRVGGRMRDEGVTHG